MGCKRVLGSNATLRWQSIDGKSPNEGASRSLHCNIKEEVPREYHLLLLSFRHLIYQYTNVKNAISYVPVESIEIQVVWQNPHFSFGRPENIGKVLYASSSSAICKTRALSGGNENFMVDGRGEDETCLRNDFVFSPYYPISSNVLGMELGEGYPLWNSLVVTTVEP